MKTPAGFRHLANGSKSRFHPAAAFAGAFPAARVSQPASLGDSAARSQCRQSPPGAGAFPKSGFMDANPPMQGIPAESAAAPPIARPGCPAFCQRGQRFFAPPGRPSAVGVQCKGRVTAESRLQSFDEHWLNVVSGSAGDAARPAGQRLGRENNRGCPADANGRVVGGMRAKYKICGGRNHPRRQIRAGSLSKESGSRRPAMMPGR